MHQTTFISILYFGLLMKEAVFGEPDYNRQTGIRFRSEIDEYMDLERKIDELTALLHEIEENITRYAERDLTCGKLQSIKLSVEELTGNGCDKGEFRCGMVYPQCIPSFLTCDGYSDCPNGEDEVDCDALFAVGDVWTCRVIYDYCTPITANDVYSRLRITGHEVTEHIKAQAEVKMNFKASLIFPWKWTSTAGQCQGHYVYGLRSLDYSCSQSPFVQMTCLFDGEDRNICHANMYRRGEICGRATWTKEF